VEARTSLVNTARGLAKSLGERLPVCDTDQMGTEQTKSLPVGLQRVLEPLMGQVVSLTERIKEMDRKVEQIAREDYPETALLQQVKGVGPLIAFTFILTLDDKARFQKSRDVAGLRPRRSESGESQPQLRITKEGDAYLRKMLVQGAHYILGHRGPDTDPQTMGTEACRTRRKAGKESSGHCSGTKIRHLAAPAMGDGRSLRTPAKREHAALTEKASGVIKSGSLQIVEFG
jgi:transposase